MATEDTPASTESADGTTDEEQIDTTPFIAAVIDHLGGAYDDKDYSLTGADEWDPIKPGLYDVADGEPAEVRISGEGPWSDFMIESGDGHELSWELVYGKSGINIFAETETDDARGGLTLGLDADGARDLARALLMAAEEFERRPVADGRGDP